VLPIFRRRGVARQLLERVEQSAREADCSAIELHVAEKNPEAVALYENAGYQRIGREKAYYGRGEDALRYKKPIGQEILD
jgi:ribosomal protein S18 acetylase RimI-like enzyme